MQQASLIHAAEHAFHQYEAACDVFIAAENQKLDNQAASINTIVGVVSHQLTFFFPVTLKSDDVVSRYRSRAPPIHIV